MKESIETFLAIIAAKSLIGFFDERNYMPIDWKFLFIITSFSVVGIFIGSACLKKMKTQNSKLLLDGLFF